MSGSRANGRISRRTALVVAAVLGLAGAGVTGVLMVVDEPAPLRDLERAEEAGTAAQRATRRLSENLDRIAENLAAGEDLEGQGAEIEGLTEDQRRSLEKLAELLRSQLRSLEGSVEELRSTSRSSERVAQLGARQTALVRRTVAALRELRVLARSAGATSAEIARQSVYGARLAEDAQRSFSEP